MAWKKIFLYFSPSSIECATLKLITMSTDLLFVGTTLSSAQWRRKAQNMAPRSPDLQAHIQSSFLVRSFDLHFGHLTVSYSLNQYSVLKLLILRDDPTNQWNKFWEWHVPVRCTPARAGSNLMVPLQRVQHIWQNKLVQLFNY